MRSWRSDYEVVPLLKRLEERFANAFASAITSAVEAERERAAKIAENGMAYSSGIEIATAIRQTPTQEGV
jgi:hypothetical protein